MDADDWPRRVAYARFGYAALALFTPRLAASSFGVRRSEMTPAAAAWAAVFASREAALGALSLSGQCRGGDACADAWRINAAVDALDAVILVALARWRGQRRPLLVALPAAVASVAIHLRAVRRLPGASNGPVPAAPSAGT
ncbi:MAG TPA: hypothetical protein VHL53_23665 [Acidimicrobiia bacterium]|nr:hypothetical protein [Acidimicrobiia bacterium]